MSRQSGTYTVDHLAKSIRVGTKNPNQFFEGVFRAFDTHMNLVLDECIQIRRKRIRTSPNANYATVEERRYLGIMVLRGEFVQSLIVLEKQLDKNNNGPTVSEVSSTPSRVGGGCFDVPRPRRKKPEECASRSLNEAPTEAKPPKVKDECKTQ